MVSIPIEAVDASAKCDQMVPFRQGDVGETQAVKEISVTYSATLKPGPLAPVHFESNIPDYVGVAQEIGEGNFLNQALGDCDLKNYQI